MDLVKRYPGAGDRGAGSALRKRMGWIQTAAFSDEGCLFCLSSFLQISGTTSGWRVCGRLLRGSGHHLSRLKIAFVTAELGNTQFSSSWGKQWSLSHCGLTRGTVALTWSNQSLILGGDGA